MKRNGEEILSSHSLKKQKTNDSPGNINCELLLNALALVNQIDPLHLREAGHYLMELNAKISGFSSSYCHDLASLIPIEIW